MSRSRWTDAFALGGEHLPGLDDRPPEAWGNRMILVINPEDGAVADHHPELYPMLPIEYIDMISTNTPAMSVQVRLVT